MNILIAEDDSISRHLLERTLAKWGHEVVVTTNGLEAWTTLQSADSPRLAILDWMMPGMDGVEICRKLRRSRADDFFYVIMLTAKQQKTDLVEGMNAGADDYVIKPFDAQELRVRVRAGERILELEARAREAGKLSAVCDIAAGVAHNFNNILSAVLGYASFVRTGLREQQADLQDIEMVIESTKRAAALADQLLSCARPTGGATDTVTLGALVEAIVSECESTLPENIRLVGDIAESDCRLRVEPHRLRTALLNMCTNAREAMPEGGILKIEGSKVGRQTQEGEPQFVQVDIADTGRGMDADMLPKIFDPFFSTKGTVGVGISLAFTRRVIEDHGGRIAVDSSPDKGSTFRVFLPILNGSHTMTP